VVAQLRGSWVWVVRNVFAVGWLPRNFSSSEPGVGSPPLRAIACSNALKSLDVETGNPLKLWLTMSVFEPSDIRNLIAKPRGLALTSVSGMFGRPVKSEKRTTTGTEDSMKSWARHSSLASALGV
jgi:hypothetical protein